jgi:hypothetical protein
VSVESESLLAVTGCISPKINESLSRMAELPDRLQGRIDRWLRSRGPARPWTPPPYHDPAKLRDRLIHTPDELRGHDGLDEVLAAEWVQEVKDARKSLVDRWPGIPLRGGLTALEPPLAHDAAWDWLALVAVVDEPLRLLDELEAGALLPAQLEVFQEVYPELTRVVTEAVFRVVVDLAARGTDLPETKERMLRLVLGTPEDQPIVLPPTEEPPPPKKSGGGDAAEGLETVAQKSGT